MSGLLRLARRLGHVFQSAIEPLFGLVRPGLSGRFTELLDLGLFRHAQTTTKKAKNLSAWFKHSAVRVFPRCRFTEEFFEPYVKAIGSLLLAWNDFHEKLSNRFVMAMDPPHFARSYAVWHEARADLSKRRLLRAAIANLPGNEITQRTKLIKEIAWILDAADKLEGFRDDSVHTPVQFSFPNILSLNLLRIDGHL